MLFSRKMEGKRRGKKREEIFKEPLRGLTGGRKEIPEAVSLPRVNKEERI